MDLSRIDLNLLPPLIALLDERQITRAAERAGLSQPAMSRAFQRLRRTLGDDLLVRSPAGYRLTPRAERIREQLAVVVPGLTDLFNGDLFEPATLRRSIQVGGSDYGISVLGIPLARRVIDAAPRATVCFRPWHGGSFEQLAHGELDLVFYGAQLPASLCGTPLFAERFVCLVADTHPLAGRESVDLEEYLTYRHLVVDIVDGLQPAVDEILGARGMPRKVGTIMPFHMLAPHALTGTDLVLTFPERLVGRYADLSGIAMVAGPSEIGTMVYRMAWHPRMDGDPVHRWLRDTVIAVARELQ
ncbi:LysR family transcriptional regulator [Micromonospora sp. 15K316]|uniref:LysR family transcriptional regulator n=1 Tax=Micromonospora sp. 15K316 TaxID=2530376 RepID=UPI00140429A8|nr:LysR family transcriptional regulator [Micromonospora sp. 15K316]